ncbi:MAG: GNAT family N-acetyltransferase [Saprospiraceae bacterium]
MKLEVNESIELMLLNESHAPEIYNLAKDNREYLSQWLTWPPFMESQDFIANFIKGSMDRNSRGEEYGFSIFYNNVIVGRIGVHKIDLHNRIGEIGYWIGAEYEGKGIMMQSCESIVEFCFHFLKLNRIEIKCGTENYKSQNIPKKLNFSEEGIIREGEFLRTGYIDLYLYSLLKSEL